MAPTGCHTGTLQTRVHQQTSTTGPYTNTRPLLGHVHPHQITTGRCTPTDAAALLARQQQCLLQPVSWSPVSEGFVGDQWLSITLTLCHILHSISHWPVLVYYFTSTTGRCTPTNQHHRPVYTHTRAGLMSHTAFRQSLACVSLLFHPHLSN
jgi:hypothetical protein